MPAPDIGRRTDETGDGGTSSIGTDDETGPYVAYGAGFVDQRHARDATGSVPQKARHSDPVVHMRASFVSRFDHRSVEHRSPRREQGVDAMPRLDVDLHRVGSPLIGVDEGGLLDPRGVLPFEAFRDAPSIQKQNCGTHERMGRQGVGSEPALVEDEHSKAAGGEEHRGCSAGDARADDDDIVRVVDGLRGHDVRS